MKNLVRYGNTFLYTGNGVEVINPDKLIASSLSFYRNILPDMSSSKPEKVTSKMNIAGVYALLFKNMMLNPSQETLDLLCRHYSKLVKKSDATASLKELLPNSAYICQVWPSKFATISKAYLIYLWDNGAVLLSPDFNIGHAEEFLAKCGYQFDSTLFSEKIDCAKSTLVTIKSFLLTSNLHHLDDVSKNDFWLMARDNKYPYPGRGVSLLKRIYHSIEGSPNDAEIIDFLVKARVFDMAAANELPHRLLNIDDVDQLLEAIVQIEHVDVIDFDKCLMDSMKHQKLANHGGLTMNTGDSLVILNPKRIQEVVDNFTQMAFRHGAVPVKIDLTPTVNKYLPFVFRHLFESYLKNCTEAKLNALYEAVYLDRNKNTDAQCNIEHLIGRKVEPSWVGPVRSAIKALFTVLWDHHVVLLTHKFSKGRSTKFLSNMNYKYQSSAMRGWLEWRFQTRRDASVSGAIQFMTSTKWYEIEQISIEDYWFMLRNEMLPKKLNAKSYFKLALHLGAISKATFDLVYADKGSNYARNVAKDISLNTLEELREYQSSFFRVNASRRASKISRQLSQAKRRLKYVGVDSNDPFSMLIPSRLKYYHTSCQTRKYLQLLGSYRKNYKTMDFFDPGYYIGGLYAEGITEDRYKEWKIVGKAWISYEYNKATSRGDQAQLTLGVLADYIVYYLPHFYNENPDALFEIPYKVSQFRRVAHWNRFNIIDVDTPKPLTLLDVFNLRWNGDGVYSASLSLRRMFEFVIAFMSDNQEGYGVKIVEPNYLNPVKMDVDNHWKRKSKPTNKVALPKRTLPFIVNTMRVLEDAMFTIQQRVLEMNYDEAKSIYTDYFRNDNPFFSLKSLGVDCGFTLKTPEGQEKLVEFDRIPNLFTWRLVTKNNEERNVPALSCFRMLRTNLHAGQRMENIQWLDIDEFDMYGRIPDSYMQPIVISADKLGEPRICQVPYYIYDSLQKEKKFQETAFPRESLPCPTKKGGTTIIRPLFRLWKEGDNSNHRPISDATYRAMWTDLLQFIQVGFNSFVDTKKNEHSFVYLSPRKDISKETVDWNMGEPCKVVHCQYTEAQVYEEGHPIFNEEDIVVEEHQGNASALEYKAVHVPHSIRNTYTVSHEALLDDNELMLQQGWLTKSMKKHYAQGIHRDDLNKRLEIFERSIMCTDETISNLQDEAILTGKTAFKPSFQNSDLRNSLNNGVKQFILEQSPLSICPDHIGRYEGKSGMVLLKTQPLTQMTVYDDCICPVGGHCPKEVLNVIFDSMRCGLCPIAIHGHDHIGGMMAKARSLVAEAKEGLEQLEWLDEMQVAPEEMEKIRRNIRFNQLEAASLTMASGMFSTKAEDLSDKYLARNPEMTKQAFEISLDQEGQVERVLSKLIDAQSYPQYTSSKYMSELEMLARKIRASGAKIQETHPLDVVAGHIISTLKVHGVTLQEFAQAGYLECFLEPQSSGEN
ncbi:hypothetical protein [Vibrio owensii]|uniref:hypothetical protein n=1 Tax=Vibrio owensii TaxID=696485 RepID=UPI0005979080|nr:hypothetical protein [Vibrio owensii]